MSVQEDPCYRKKTDIDTVYLQKRCTKCCYLDRFRQVVSIFEIFVVTSYVSNVQSSELIIGDFINDEIISSFEVKS